MFCPPSAVTDRTDRSSNRLPGQLLLVTVILFNRIFMASIIRSPVPSPTADSHHMRVVVLVRQAAVLPITIISFSELTSSIFAQLNHIPSGNHVVRLQYL